MVRHLLIAFANNLNPGPEVIKLFMLTSTEHKVSKKKLSHWQIKKFLALSLSDIVFIMLINVKMLTIVGQFNIYEQDKFCAQLSWAWKKYNLRAKSGPTKCWARSGSKLFDALVVVLNSFHVSGDFCHLLITFANSLAPDQDRQNFSPDLDSNRLTLWQYFWKKFLKRLIMLQVNFVFGKQVLLQTVKTQMRNQHNAAFHQGLHCL